LDPKSIASWAYLSSPRTTKIKFQHSFVNTMQLPPLPQLLILTTLLLLNFFTPLQALATPINPQLEQQILQTIRNHPEVILESVQTYQQQQQEDQNKAQQTALQPLKNNPKASIGTSPTTGSPEQKIVLLEFSDFQCPYCATAHKTLKQLIAKHPNQLTLAYKHYPLTRIHDQAMPAAQAAWAAAQQNQFWPYHDALFADQKQLGEPLYLATAKKLNLDLAQFDRDRHSPAAQTAIQQDIDLANRLGIQGTPFLILNGEIWDGAIDLASLEGAIADIQK
jgi:protein-disulfide isomerase